MEVNRAALSQGDAASRLLGWLNLSDGRPNPKWQRQLDDSYAIIASSQPDRPWEVLHRWLGEELTALEAAGNAAFRDCTQARAALSLIFEHVLPAYRRRHADLLAHLEDEELFTAFFIARVAEAVLSQGGSWDETERIVRATLQKLNDYVGYRPVAVLESRPHSEYYAHEKVRPVPIYIKGAGAAHGPYEEIVVKALELLAHTDPDILQDACFDPNMMEELAFDPRPIDHGHPVNRRPNYLFGEWDPHQIDGKGHFRRFIIRKGTLDEVVARLPAEDSQEVKRAERVFEAGAVLAGTILMAAGTSGSGPAMYDSTVTLSKLVPKIARYRDAFYKRLIASVDGEHGEKLRSEAVQMRQPFASARQHVNQVLARQRAIELQESHLALIFAEMGYPEASRRRAGRIEAVSVRMLAEMRLRLTAGHFAIEKGKLADAAGMMAEIEDLLHRGIECGAIADPWNAIGFQGLFPLFSSREDSVRDTRLDDLIETVSRIFHLYAEMLAAAASAGETSLRQDFSRRLREFASWWDQHATYEVSDFPLVHGHERAAAAEHVADALAGVRGASAKASDLAYWRQHREGFRAPQAFAQVIDALLRQRDYKSAMALLMTWLSEAVTVPLDDDSDSFHDLARRWLHEVIESESPLSERISLVMRFFTHLEANADELWLVPELNLAERDDDEEPDDVAQSAYEGVTFQDTADDDEEGSVAGGEKATDYFPLEEEADQLHERLEFLSTVSVLWQAVVPFIRPHVADHVELAAALASWHATTQSWLPPLLELLDRVHKLKVPDPVGGFEEVMEYDRRRILCEHLSEVVVETALETSLAGRMLGSVGLPSEDGSHPPKSEESPPPGEDSAAESEESPEHLDWEPLALKLEAELGRGDPESVRRVLPEFMEVFRRQPLLFVPMASGGHPRQVLQARQAQVMLRSLLERLPRLGLIRETYHLIQLAKAMEQNAVPAGRKISEFDQLFSIALQSVLEALLDAAHSWPPIDLQGDDLLIELLRQITDSFLKLWVSHSQTLRLSMLEAPPPGVDWDDLRDFIKTYGGDLFTPHFLALANLRSLTHRGVEDWLKAQANEAEPLKLVEAIEDGRIALSKAAVCLDYIAQVLIEHHEVYRDYNSTTTQSDYGENLHLLFEFLKLKVAYDRCAWRMRPLVQAHAVLCRRGQDAAAQRWHEKMAEMTKTTITEPMLENLAELEQNTGLRLRSVRDRLEERLVRPLIIDRLCSQVEPAMREAANPSDDAAFKRLEQRLELLTRQPIGIGLELPEWLERLEDEVDRVRHEKDDGERPLASGSAARVVLSLSDLQSQLANWDNPL
jgi:hypothetical protein